MQKQARDDSLLVMPVKLAHRLRGASFEGVVHRGSGRAVIEAVAATVGKSPLGVLAEVVSGLLAKKGVDWTGTILAEYLGLYGKNHGAFCLISESRTGMLVAHAVVFQSAAHGGAGLLAHVRTADGWGGYGLGTLATEEVTRRALDQGASVVVLDTDDKLHRKKQGERAAFGMYGKIGYTVLAEKKMSDAMGWLMVIDRDIQGRCQRLKASRFGEYAAELPTELVQAQHRLIAATRQRYSEASELAAANPVCVDDLADLFLLLNLCPAGDFRIKLGSWGVVQGPEFERSFVVNIRPALLDRDRLEDASLVLRDPGTGIVAVCAARQAIPFDRQAFYIDFYCLPQFLEGHPEKIRALVEATICRIRDAAERPRPCRLLHAGVDGQKLGVFAGLGFVRGANVHAFHGPDGSSVMLVEEHEKIVA